MGRPKGKKSEYTFRTKKEKFKIIKPIIDGKKSSNQVTKITGISNGLITNWIKAYNEKGIDGLENKKKPGNPLASLIHLKSPTYEQQLELENMRLRIENERLKKGYTTEEVDHIKKSLEKNMK